MNDATMERVLAGVDGARRAGWAKVYELDARLREMEEIQADTDVQLRAWQTTAYYLAETLYAERHGVRVPVRLPSYAFLPENQHFPRLIRLALRKSWRLAIGLYRVEWAAPPQVRWDNTVRAGQVGNDLTVSQPNGMVPSN